MSGVYAFGTSELTFSANHATIDDWRKRLRFATFAKQHDFSEIEIRELSCGTRCRARPARDTERNTWFFFQQFFIYFKPTEIQIYLCTLVFFISKINHHL